MYYWIEFYHITVRKEIENNFLIIKIYISRTKFARLTLKKNI